jgi:hypothetical protein
MSVLFWLISNPSILAILAGIIGFFGYGKYKERVGAKRVRAEQAAAEQRARDVAEQVDNDIGAMTPIQRREALRKWAKK